MTAAAERTLRCAECGREADERARGWRALHGREEPEDQVEALVVCEKCFEREFADDALAQRER